MRKVLCILGLILFGVIFSGCDKKNGGENTPACNHIDANKDGICDLCKETVPVHHKTEEEIIAELLDEPVGAATHKVYYNLMDGSDYTNRYSEVKDMCTLTRPTEPGREGYEFKGWFIDKDFSELYDFREVVVESMMLYAKWELYVGPDFSYILNEYVPDTLNESITLPKTIDGLKGVTLAWGSSDKITLSTTGQINPARTDTTVTVTLEVYNDGHMTTYNKDVVVEAAQFSTLREGKAIFGYYSTWNFFGYTEDQLMIDVVNVSFGDVTENFGVSINSIESLLMQFMAAREKGVRVVLSVHGTENASTNIANAAKTEEGRKTLATNIVNIIEKYHFDGIDVDWEYPGWFYTAIDRHAEAGNYTALMKEIYTQVKASNPDYLVTAALPGGSEGWQRYDLPDVEPYLDYIHLMTYDLEASSRIFHHCALFGNTMKTTMTYGAAYDSVELYHLHGIPYNKLVVGVAFYGKSTHPESAGTNGGLGGNSKDGKYTTIAYTAIYNNYISKGSVVELWDDVCYANYLYCKNENLFITYDSVKAIGFKCKYVRGQAVETHEAGEPLGGIMIWELGEDRIGHLMDAVLVGMKRK